MNDLRDLYQEVILDHYKRPRNFGSIAAASHRAEGNNPICGDKLTVFLRIEGDRVAEVRFQGSGCAISTASASLMTEAIKGKSEAEVRSMFERFQTGSRRRTRLRRPAHWRILTNSQSLAACASFRSA